MANTTQTITILGTQTINLQNITLPGSAAPSVTFPETGQVSVSLVSDVKYSGSTWPLNQVLLFNTAPLVSGDYYRWFYTANTAEGITMNVTAGQPIYAFIVDQVTSSDNTGSMTLTFTPVQ